MFIIGLKTGFGIDRDRIFLKNVELHLQESPMRLSHFHTIIDSMIQEVFFMKKNNDFPLRSAAKEIKMSWPTSSI